MKRSSKELKEVEVLTHKKCSVCPNMFGLLVESSTKCATCEVRTCDVPPNTDKEFSAMFGESYRRRWICKHYYASTKCPVSLITFGENHEIRLEGEHNRADHRHDLAISVASRRRQCHTCTGAIHGNIEAFDGDIMNHTKRLSALEQAGSKKATEAQQEIRRLKEENAAVQAQLATLQNRIIWAMVTNSGKDGSTFGVVAGGAGDNGNNAIESDANNNSAPSSPFIVTQDNASNNITPKEKIQPKRKFPELDEVSSTAPAEVNVKKDNACSLPKSRPDEFKVTMIKSTEETAVEVEGAGGVKRVAQMIAKLNQTSRAFSSSALPKPVTSFRGSKLPVKAVMSTSGIPNEERSDAHWKPCNSEQNQKPTFSSKVRTLAMAWECGNYTKKN